MNGEHRLAPRRILRPGDSADVRFPPRRTRLTARFLRAEPNGDLTFIHPHNGGLRTVAPENVGRIRRPSTTEVDQHGPS